MKKILFMIVTIFMIFLIHTSSFAISNDIAPGKLVESSETFSNEYVFLSYDEETDKYFISTENNTILCYFDTDGKCYLCYGIYNGMLYNDGEVVKPESDLYFYKDSFLYVVDSNGLIKPYVKSESSGSHYMIIDDICYSVENKTGAAKVFTGIYNGKYYKSGKVYSSSSSTYIYQGGYVYLVEKNGTAKKYVKTANKSGTYKLTVSGLLYNVKYSTGAASVYTGIYSGKYYKSGKVYSSSSSTYIYQGGYVYLVEKNGTAKKYVKTANKSGTYKLTVSGLLYNVKYSTGAASAYTGIYSGKYYKSGKVYSSSSSTYVYYGGYIYSVAKNGAAKKYIKSSKKTGTYKLTVGGLLYNVKYSTGAASKFTGVYSSKYYKSGKIGTASSTYYKYYNGYIYKVKKTGKATKYVKSSKKSGKYLLTVDKVPYSVDIKTGAAKKITTGWYTLDSKKYYYKKGKYVKGWQKISDKYYYFSGKGVMSKNCIVGKYYVDTNGVRCTDKVIQLAVKFVNAHSNKSDSNKVRLKACYNYLYRNGSYTRIYGVPGKSDLPTRAKNMFNSLNGNCYSFASMFAYIAKVLGYEAKVEVGQVVSSNKAWANHGWTLVKYGGKWYMCDPVKQWQYRNINSYMVTKSTAHFKYRNGTKYSLTVSNGKAYWK